MAGKPKNIDAYMAGLTEDKREALQRLREIIQATAPDAVECISYQIPTFRLNGMLVSFAAWSHHCALYPLSVATMATLEAELAGYDTDKGTIRFKPDAPLPAALVQKLVEARDEENSRRKRARA